MMLRKLKVIIEKFIQPLGIVSPSEIAMTDGLHFSYWFNVGIMEQMLQEIEQQRGKLPAYCFDNEVTEHEIAKIVRKHDFNKLCFGGRWARFDA